MPGNFQHFVPEILIKRNEPFSDSKKTFGIKEKKSLPADLPVVCVSLINENLSITQVQVNRM